MKLGIKPTLIYLYSMLMLLLFLDNSFISTYVTERLGFRWGRIHLLVTIITILIVIIQRNNRYRLKNMLNDKYLVFALLIFIWGTLSSLFSIQVVLSMKKTISVFLVFIAFYLIPRYYFFEEEKNSFLSFIFYPLNILISLLSLINTLFYLGLIKVDNYIPLWTIKETIFENSNTLGVRIMIVLMVMNIYLTIDNNVKKRLENCKPLKFYILLNYFLLILNLIFSGSRTSFLGIGVAFIPIIYKYRMKMIIAILPLGYFLIRKKDELYIIRKLSKGTSGRSVFWIYALKEVIPKYLFLGVGSGAYQEYIGYKFGHRNMHNSYLEEALSNGIVGLVIWIILLIMIFRDISKLRFNKGIFIFTILGYIAYSFFEIGLFGELNLNMSIFWAIMVLIQEKLCSSKHYKRK